MTPPEGHVQAQYGTSARLQARIETHRRYTVGPDLEETVDRALSLRGTEEVVDVGCGPGTFLGRLAGGGHRGALSGVDLSPGMVAEAALAFPGVRFQVADAAALPFPDGYTDLVTARHMLYHVPDARAALREAHRILKSGGRFLAVTNAAGYMQEWWDAFEAAMHTGGSPLAVRHADSLKFNEVDGAALVREVFGNVSLTFMEAALLFPSPEATLGYLHSLFDAEPPAGAAERFVAEVARRSLPEGWRVSKRVVLLSATKT